MAAQAISRVRLEQLTFLTLARAITQLYGPIRSALTERGMSVSRITLLGILVSKHEATASELARSLMLTNGSITPLLKKLEAEGLLRKTRKQGDRRILHIQATDKARVELDRLYLATPRELKEVFARWTADDMKKLQHLLAGLNNGEH